MKKLLAKTLIILAVGLLFTHQSIAHHHHDEIEATSHHESDHDNDDQGLPSHSVDHIFSVSKPPTDLAKVLNCECILVYWLASGLSKAETIPSTKYYSADLGPPAANYFSSISHRGPPSC